MIDITVLLLDGTFSSTAVGPMEVFQHTGTLWNMFAGKPPRLAFGLRRHLWTGARCGATGPSRSGRRQPWRTFARRKSSLFPPRGPACMTW